MDMEDFSSGRMHSMTYPNFIVHEERGTLIPYIKLPTDFRELVPRFYEKGGKEKIEKYKKEIMESTVVGEGQEILLRWHSVKGLEHISIVESRAGLDLNEDGFPSFQEHNVQWKSALILSAIAMEYVRELLRNNGR